MRRHADVGHGEKVCPDYPLLGWVSRGNFPPSYHHWEKPQQGGTQGVNRTIQGLLMNVCCPLFAPDPIKYFHQTIVICLFVCKPSAVLENGFGVGFVAQSPSYPVIVISACIQRALEINHLSRDHRAITLSIRYLHLYCNII